MSDTSPVEIKGKGGQKANAKQTKMLIVLGVVFALLMVIQLPKLLGGGSSEPTPVPSAGPAAGGVGAAGVPTVAAVAPPVERTPPPERPRRSPFDAPR